MIEASLCSSKLDSRCSSRFVGCTRLMFGVVARVGFGLVWSAFRGNAWRVWASLDEARYTRLVMQKKPDTNTVSL